MVVAVRIGACQSFARHKGHRALSHACTKPEVFIVFWKGSGSGVLDELLHVSQGGKAHCKRIYEDEVARPVPAPTTYFSLCFSRALRLASSLKLDLKVSFD
jgi:hypothetical protein